MPWADPKAQSGADMDPNDHQVGRVELMDIALVIAVMGKEVMVLCRDQFGWAMVEDFEP